MADIKIRKRKREPGVAEGFDLGEDVPADPPHISNSHTPPRSQEGGTGKIGHQIRRSATDLSEAEIGELLDRLADDVLTPMGVAGSRAGVYSLYDAIEGEIECGQARLREGEHAAPGSEGSARGQIVRGTRSWEKTVTSMKNRRAESSRWGSPELVIARLEGLLTQVELVGDEIEKLNPSGSISLKQLVSAMRWLDRHLEKAASEEEYRVGFMMMGILAQRWLRVSE